MVYNLKGHKGPVKCLRLSPDNKKLLSCGVDNTVRIWDIEKGNQIRCWSSKELNCVAMSADGMKVFGGSSQGPIYVWNMNDKIDKNSDISPLLGHTLEVFSMSLAGYRMNYLVSASEDQTTRVWDVKLDACIWEIHDDVCSIGSQLQGDLFASGLQEGIVKVWNLQSKSCESILKPNSPPLSLAWTPDGACLAVGTYDGTTIWDVRNQSLLCNLKWVGEFLFFSPSGSTLIMLNDRFQFWDWLSNSQNSVRFQSGVKCMSDGLYNGNIAFFNKSDGVIRPMDVTKYLSRRETQIHIEDTIPCAVNDSSRLGVDRLGFMPYAQAMYNVLSNVDPPLCVGLYARWGSGKSFMIQRLKFNFDKSLNTHPRTKELLQWFEEYWTPFPSGAKENGQENGYDSDNNECSILLRILYTGLQKRLNCIKFHFNLYGICVSTTFRIMYGLFPKSHYVIGLVYELIKADISNLAVYVAHIFKPTCWVVFMIMRVPIIICAGLFDQFCSCINYVVAHLSCRFNIEYEPLHYCSTYVFRLLGYDFFDYKEEKQTEKEYVFVDFNAWEFSRSDELWAGLIRNLYSKVELRLEKHNSEEYFSAIGRPKTVRLQDREDDWKRRWRFQKAKELLVQRYGGLIPLKVRLWMLVIFLSGIVTVIILSILGVVDIWTEFIAGFSSIFGVVVGGGVALIAGLQSFRLLYETNRTVNKSRGDLIFEEANRVQDTIGFLSCVRNELEELFAFMRLYEEETSIKLVLVVFVDDLDRCLEGRNVKVLEAIQLVLAIPGAPVLCFLAIDSRVVVASIEESINKSLNIKDALISGWEYMDKIVQVPFCLPDPASELVDYYIDSCIEAAEDVLTIAELVRSTVRLAGNTHSITGKYNQWYIGWHRPSLSILFIDTSLDAREREEYFISIRTLANISKAHHILAKTTDKRLLELAIQTALELGKRLCATCQTYVRMYERSLRGDYDGGFGRDAILDLLCRKLRQYLKDATIVINDFRLIGRSDDIELMAAQGSVVFYKSQGLDNGGCKYLKICQYDILDRTLVSMIFLKTDVMNDVVEKIFISAKGNSLIAVVRSTASSAVFERKFLIWRDLGSSWSCYNDSISAVATISCDCVVNELFVCDTANKFLAFCNRDGKTTLELWTLHLFSDPKFSSVAIPHSDNVFLMCTKSDESSMYFVSRDRPKVIFSFSLQAPITVSTSLLLEYKEAIIAMVVTPNGDKIVFLTTSGELVVKALNMESTSLLTVPIQHKSFSFDQTKSMKLHCSTNGDMIVICIEDSSDLIVATLCETPHFFSKNINKLEKAFVSGNGEFIISQVNGKEILMFPSPGSTKSTKIASAKPTCVVTRLTPTTVETAGDSANADGDETRGFDKYQYDPNYFSDCGLAITAFEQAKNRLLEEHKLIHLLPDGIHQTLKNLCGLAESNPRRFKRILNVVTLAQQVACCKPISNQHLDRTIADEPQWESFSKKLTKWIFLCEMYPYRMSFLVQMLTDMEQKRLFNEDLKKMNSTKEDPHMFFYCNEQLQPLLHTLHCVSMFSFYHEYVEKYIYAIPSADKLLRLDSDPELFASLLHENVKCVAVNLICGDILGMIPVQKKRDEAVECKDHHDDDKDDDKWVKDSNFSLLSYSFNLNPSMSRQISLEIQSFMSEYEVMKRPSVSEEGVSPPSYAQRFFSLKEKLFGEHSYVIHSKHDVLRGQALPVQDMLSQSFILQRQTQQLLLGNQMRYNDTNTEDDGGLRSRVVIKEQQQNQNDGCDDEDVLCLQRYLIDHVRLGKKNAKKYAELFVAAEIDSVEVLKALKISVLNSFIKQWTIPPCVADVLTEHLMKHQRSTLSNNNELKDDTMAVDVTPHLQTELFTMSDIYNRGATDVHFKSNDLVEPETSSLPPPPLKTSELEIAEKVADSSSSVKEDHGMHFEPCKTEGTSVGSNPTEIDDINFVRDKKPIKITPSQMTEIGLQKSSTTIATATNTSVEVESTASSSASNRLSKKFNNNTTVGKKIKPFFDVFESKP